MLIICAQHHNGFKVLTDDPKKDGEEILLYSNDFPVLVNIVYDKEDHKKIMGKLYDKYIKKEIFKK